MLQKARNIKRLYQTWRAIIDRGFEGFTKKYIKAKPVCCNAGMF